MVVDDIHIFRSKARPAKHYTPLIVHSDAVKSAPAAFQGFQPVSGWRSEVSQFVCVVDHVQFAGNDAGNIVPAEAGTGPSSLEERLDGLIGKAPNRHCVAAVYLDEVYIATAAFIQTPASE